MIENPDAARMLVGSIKHLVRQLTADISTALGVAREDADYSWLRSLPRLETFILRANFWEVSTENSSTTAWDPEEFPVISRDNFVAPVATFHEDVLEHCKELCRLNDRRVLLVQVQAAV